MGNPVGWLLRATSNNKATSHSVFTEETHKVKSAQVIFNLSINTVSARLLLSIQLDVKYLGKTEDLFVVCAFWENNHGEICCHKRKKERVCLALQKAWNRRKQEVWWTPLSGKEKKKSGNCAASYLRKKSGMILEPLCTSFSGLWNLCYSSRLVFLNE